MTEPHALRLHGLTRRYGSVLAVADVDLAVRTGSRHAVIGPNGAGKSTLLSLIAGTTRPTSGSIVAAGRPVTHLREPRRAGLGIVRTFQHAALFEGLSVAENVLLAVERRITGARSPFPRRTRRDRLLDTVGECLQRVGLSGRGPAPVASLSHGERRQLEVAVALGTAPRLLLLDEPTAGMSTVETQTLVSMVAALPRTVTVLIVEHDLDVVFQLAQEITVLVAGRVIASGSPSEIRTNTEVQEAYLGVPGATFRGGTG